EVGDADKPRLVFFFDEAHLLFDDAPGALLDKIEQVVRLIRSKGVGVYFVTQNPLDIPDPVLGQLGHRIQHALRAFTPRDQKAVRAAAQTMRTNPDLDIGTAITELGVGEALVSMLDAKGRPGVTQRVWMAAPGSRIGPATPAALAAVRAGSLVGNIYDMALDRESAYEVLKQRAADVPVGKPLPAGAAPSGAAPSTASPDGTASDGKPDWMQSVNELLFGSTGPRGGRRDGIVQSVVKSTARSLGTQLV